MTYFSIPNIVLSILRTTMRNGQTYFKNLAVFTPQDF